METKENRPLTAKEERFCSEYALHLNATKAAINAGYSKNTARTIGSQNLTKLNIKNRIEHLRANLAEAAEVSALRIVNELKAIAFADWGDIKSDWSTLKEFASLTNEHKACIKEISTRQVKGELGDEEIIKITLHDKQKALEALTKILGYDAPTRMELTGKEGKDFVLKCEVINNEAAEQLRILEERLK